MTPATPAPARDKEPASTPNRPAAEPGGCECIECGRIFIGAEWHVECALCAEDAA